MHDDSKPVWLADIQVGNRYNVSRITVWRWAREIADFPKPRKLGPNTTRWSVSQLDEYDRRKLGAAA